MTGGSHTICAFFLTRNDSYLNLANVYENMGTAYHVRAQQQLEEAKRVAKKCIDQDHKEVQDIQENHCSCLVPRVL